MIRFISFLLGKQYESCKGCEILKQQLQMVNEEKKQLTDTLLGIINPKAPPLPENVNQPVPIQAAVTFSKRRQILEERDRIAAKTIRESKIIGMPDDVKTRDIDKLERDLGINHEDEQKEEVK